MNRIDEEIIIMKKSMAKLVREKDKDFIGILERWNQKLVLAVADFKCQRCLSDENLQIHHLIMRKAKEFMDFWRYASQRYYWANQIVLCKECHDNYHGYMGKDIGEDKIISKNRIKEIKDFFI